MNICMQPLQLDQCANHINARYQLIPDTSSSLSPGPDNEDNGRLTDCLGLPRAGNWSHINLANVQDSSPSITSLLLPPPPPPLALSTITISNGPPTMLHASPAKPILGMLDAAEAYEHMLWEIFYNDLFSTLPRTLAVLAVITALATLVLLPDFSCTTSPARRLSSLRYARPISVFRAV